MTKTTRESPARRNLRAYRHLMLEAFEAVPGVAPHEVLARLSQLLHDGKRYIAASKDGKITDIQAVPDGTLAIAAAREINTLADAYPEKRFAVHNTFRMEAAIDALPQLEDITDAELVALAQLPAAPDGTIE